MEETVKFSVTIPAYKDKYLGETIDSVLAQTYSNFEVVIVNDASPYDLDSIVAQYDDPRIRYFKNEKNCGARHVVDNWNICLGHATGEYLICMGDDDNLTPRCLADFRSSTTRATPTWATGSSRRRRCGATAASTSCPSAGRATT